MARGASAVARRTAAKRHELGLVTATAYLGLLFPLMRSVTGRALLVTVPALSLVALGAEGLFCRLVRAMAALTFLVFFGFDAAQQRRLLFVAVAAGLCACRKLVGFVAAVAPFVALDERGRKRRFGLFVAAFTALPEHGAEPVHLMAAAAIEILRPHLHVVLLGNLRVAARAIAAGNALFWLLRVRSVTQTARLQVAVDHRRRNFLAFDHSGEARTAPRHLATTMTALAIRGRRAGGLRHVVVARQANSLAEAGQLLRPVVEKSDLVVALLTRTRFRRERVPLRFVALGARERFLRLEHVFAVAGSARQVPGLERAARVAALAGGRLDLAVRDGRFGD